MRQAAFKADSAVWSSNHRANLGVSWPSAPAAQQYMVAQVRRMHCILLQGKPKDMSKKAVLLAGPPGIGKTSCAHIIAK